MNGFRPHTKENKTSKATKQKRKKTEAGKNTTALTQGKYYSPVPLSRQNVQNTKTQAIMDKNPTTLTNKSRRKRCPLPHPSPSPSPPPAKHVLFFFRLWNSSLNSVFQPAVLGKVTEHFLSKRSFRSATRLFCFVLVLEILLRLPWGSPAARLPARCVLLQPSGVGS